MVESTDQVQVDRCYRHDGTVDLCQLYTIYIGAVDMCQLRAFPGQGATCSLWGYQVGFYVVARSVPDGSFHQGVYLPLYRTLVCSYGSRRPCGRRESAIGVALRRSTPVPDAQVHVETLFLW